MDLPEDYQEIFVPGVKDRPPSKTRVNISAAHGTYMFSSLQQHGLHSFEPEALGTAVALIDHFELDGFADVGANIGVFSWCAKAIFGASLEVWAFEPMPTLADIVTAVAVQNDLDINVRREALSHSNGDATFYLSAKTDTSNSLNRRFRPSKGELTVKTLRMDSAFDQFHPGLIKIDTESTEPDVLAGGDGYIRDQRPFLLIEVLAGRTEVQLSEFCERQNYAAYRLDGSPLSPAEKIEGDITYQYRDWLFAPAERALDAAFDKKSKDWIRAFATPSP